MSRPFLVGAVVRARGLAGRRVPPARRRALAAAGSPGVLARELAELGYGADAAPGEAAPASLAEAIDRGLRRGAAARLARVVRWIEDAGPVAAVFFHEEDRRSLRGLLRGAAAGASQADRLRTALATPGLPAALLERLAGAADPAACVQALARAGHPAGAALRGLGDADLRTLEIALGAALAAQTRAAARRGDAALRDWVAEGLDAENLWLALGGAEPEAFLPGGARLRRGVLVAAAREEPPAARRRLARALGPSPLRAVLEAPDTPASFLEARLLEARTDAWRRRARREPLGSAPLVLAVLAQRGELAALRRIHWGLEQGMAPEALAREAEAAS